MVKVAKPARTFDAVSSAILCCFFFFFFSFVFVVVHLLSFFSL